MAGGMPRGLIRATAAGVLSVNAQLPDGSGNVTLTAAQVGALALIGGTVTGPLQIAAGLAVGTASANAFSLAGGSGAPSLAVTGGANVDLQLSPAGTGLVRGSTPPSSTDNGTALATTAWVWSLPAQQQIADSASTGGNARGSGAVDWQSARNNATQVASGAQSVIGGGNSNTASATGATAAGGVSNTVSGQYATIAGGQLHSASGMNASIGGGYGNSVAGTFSWAPGGRLASDRGQVGIGVWASDRFSTTGDAQASERLLRCKPTDATATRLTADANAPSSANTINLPSNGSYYVRLQVVARQTAGTAGTTGDAAGWSVTALATRTSGSVSLVSVNGSSGNVATGLAPSEASSGAAAWRLTLSADATMQGIAVTGTGEANKTIQWVARVMAVETVG